MVNIIDMKNNFVPAITPQKDVLSLIFERQTEMIKEYQPIYIRNGFDFLVCPFPIKMDNPQHQNILHYYFKNCMLELSEAIFAYEAHEDLQAIEEVIDAMHFLVEGSIMAGFDLFEGQRDNHQCRYTLIYNTFKTKLDFNTLIVQLLKVYGGAMNCFKNKPWKQTPVSTDVNHFRNLFRDTWVAFIGLLTCLELKPEDVLKYYFNKSDVNKFRQKSQY